MATKGLLVISPLRSLIMDNIRKIETMRLGRAVNLAIASQEDVKSAGFLFSTPETLLEGNGCATLLNRSITANISLICVDKCHVVKSFGQSETGIPFKEAYDRLSEIRSFRKAPVVGLTATATDSTIQSISTSLCLKNPLLIKHCHDREDISYHVTKVTGECPSNFWCIINLIMIGIPFRMLVFFRNVHLIGNAHDYVSAKIGQSLNCPVEDRTVHMFHLSTHENRKQIVLQIMTSPPSKTQVVMRSSSFSLGLNLTGIDYVIHYGAPSSVEEYLQETGRAARELGAHGHVILLRYNRMTAGHTISPAMKEFYRSRYECRRKFLTDYLNLANTANSETCCDLCNWGLSTGNLPIKRLIDENQQIPAMSATTASTNPSTASSSIPTPDVLSADDRSAFSESDDDDT